MYDCKLMLIYIMIMMINHYVPLRQILRKICMLANQWSDILRRVFWTCVDVELGALTLPLFYFIFYFILDHYMSDFISDFVFDHYISDFISDITSYHFIFYNISDHFFLTSFLTILFLISFLTTLFLTTLFLTTTIHVLHSYEHVM